MDQSTQNATAPRWVSLAPNPKAVEEIDRSLRSSLADSLDYLANLTDNAHLPALAKDLGTRLGDGPVSPWVFVLYAHLVAHISKKQMDAALQSFSDILAAAHLPAVPRSVALGDDAIPSAWWDQLIVLVDTDRKRPFRPNPPTTEAVEKEVAEITGALGLLQQYDPEFHDEVGALIRMPVLAAPASESPEDLFNGASSFFLWGAPVINAEAKRSPISTIDLLIHEGSHLLLFGLVEGRALTRNDPTQRYPSPLRSDERPIDGIFHACFVATRVHIAMTRLIDNGLPADLSERAGKARERNGSAARESLDSLGRYAQPTERGEEVLAALRSYWADHGGG
jgi:hypothetical protein